MAPQGMFMKIVSQILITANLLTLFSCGGDISSNRKQGKPDVTIPGIEADDSLRSSIHRRRGSAVLSYRDEINLTISGELPEKNYVAVPDMALDDEGTDQENILTQSSLGRPTEVCGFASGLENISARINDCSAKNGTRAVWEGSKNGAAGEGVWRLVGRSDSGQEIWHDERSNMVWSDLMLAQNQTEFNWCQASGNTQGLTPETLINCQTLAAGISACHNLVIDGIGNQIQWRLPTRNDFLQGDLNGIRFVLRKENNLGLWTATMKAGTPGRTEAWVYHSQNGTLSSALLSSQRQVRCIGTPNL